MPNNIPEHDLTLVDRPADNIEVFSYYLGEKLVLTCTITYTDEQHQGLESMEWNYADI